MNKLMRLIGAAVLAGSIAVLLTQGTRAGTTKIGGVYSVSLAGIQFATGTMSLIIKGNAYSTEVSMTTSGIGRLVIDSRSIMKAAGWISNRRVRPARYSLHSRANNFVTDVNMSLGGGSVRRFSVRPKLRKRRDRVPMRSRHRRGVLDPLSAALMPVPGKTAVIGPQVCNRTLPIFDGWSRFDVKLRYKRLRRVNIKGYRGQAVVCGARWIPVAGHRPAKQSVQYMAENRDMEIWLIPVGRLPVFVPHKITIQTKIGLMVVQVRALKLKGSTFAKASR